MTQSQPSSDVRVGDDLPELLIGPITRAHLALYSAPSGDTNPMHIDAKFAQKAGMPDVFAHGMLSMGYLGRLLTNWTSPENIREYRVRFQSITPVEATVRCSGTVEEISQTGHETLARLALKAEIEDGTVTLTGSALVALRR